MKPQKLLACSMTAIGLLALASTARATPYACDITNSGGVVSFRLNEAADNVKVISNGGAVTNDLGPGYKGLTNASIGAVAGTVKIMVTRSAAAGYTQTSSDSFQDDSGAYVNKFFLARGVVVDKNPASPVFGRIYVANARSGPTGSPVRTSGDGIYLINSDDTSALGTNARTAGLIFTTGTDTASPLRLSIGKDDDLLYICDLSDPSGGLWVTDKNVETNSVATNVFATIGDLGITHGSIYAAVVEGSLAGNLKIFTMDEDLSATKKSAWRYDVNSGPLPSAVAPVSLGQGMTNTAIDLIRGGSSNYLYASQNNRTLGTATFPSIQVFDENGISITNSLSASRAYLGNPSAADLLQNTVALDISPDGKTLALLRGTTFGSVLLVPLTNGVFNFAGTNAFTLGVNGLSDNNRDIAYDAAGNLYVVNSGTEWLRIYSKGGASVVTTGSDGTFVLGVPPTLVSVTNSITANEQGLVNGVFTVSRTGDTSVALTVNYTVDGTAAAGADYTALSGSVTFLPGAVSTNVIVVVSQDPDPELTETVILTLTSSGSYGIMSGSATVSILDNEPTEVSISLAQAESRLLEGCSECKLGFILTRKGLVGPALTVNLTYGGTSAAGADFSGPTNVVIGASIATASFNLTPIDDESYEGTETLSVTVSNGISYVPVSPTSASGTVVDDDYPSGALLFADDFNTNSAARWTTNSVDGWVDSATDFACNYSSLYVPPVPGGTSTVGLRFRLNALTGAQRNAVSASPIGVNLTGDYRLKFKGWINYYGPMLDGGPGSTLHLMAGAGTTPDHANLATSGASDGIWFDVGPDGGSTFTVGDASAYAATTLQADNSGVYAAGTTDNPRSTTHPFYSIWGGIPAPAAQLANYPSQTGIAQAGNMGVCWHTFVITKATNAVVWAIDGITVATMPADAAPLSTNVFVGYEDIFPGPSAVPAMSFVLIENLRVETYVSAPIVVTNISLVGSNVEVRFTASDTAVPADFKLQSSAIVNGPYADENSAVIGQLGTGAFAATNSVSGPARFYRIKQ